MKARGARAVDAIELAEVDGQVRRAVAAADRSGGVQRVSVPFESPDSDPLALFERARPGDRFYWCQPARGGAIAAAGAAADGDADVYFRPGRRYLHAERTGSILDGYLL